MQQILEFLGNHLVLTGLLVVVLIVFIANEIHQSIAGIKKIAPRLAVISHNNDEAVFIDIRSQADFKKGHIQDSLNIPSTTIKDRLSDLKKHASKTIVVVCQSGMSASGAANQLKKSGIENVQILSGGIQGWLQAELPLSKGK